MSSRRPARSSRRRRRFGRPGPTIATVRSRAAASCRRHRGQACARQPHCQSVPDSRVLVTAGGNMAFMNAMLAIADPGDERSLPTPYYFNHEMAIDDGRVRTRSRCRTDRRLSTRARRASRAAITPRTRAVVTISPNNPTGAVYPGTALRAVNALCAIAASSTSTTRRTSTSRTATPTISRRDRSARRAAHTISLYSLSKAYGFASWRIGYMVIPEELFEAVNKIQDTILICPPVVSQHAALAALRGRPRLSTRVRRPSRYDRVALFSTRWAPATSRDARRPTARSITWRACGRRSIR